MAYLRQMKLSKYNNFKLNVQKLEDDYILVVDQTINDAAILKGGADANSFVNMLACAKTENPDKKIYIKTHPETDAGKRKGYFSDKDCDDQVSLITSRTSPYTLFEKATKIYCVTSQVGLEAVFAGHRPIIFGRPFYAGLGLTDDRGPAHKRALALTAAQLFWATHLKYSKWYDPYFDRKTDFLTVARVLHSRARQNQDNQLPAHCIGMRLWKRGFLKTYLSGQKHTPRFHKNADQAIEAASQESGRVMVWAGLETDAINHACTQKSVPLIRIEDGFLRSVGLGAQLIAPVSLAFDDVGIYYDPTRPSRLEHIINATSDLSDLDLERAKSIQDRIVALKMTKYNLPKSATILNAGKDQKVILVPGQVEDDASIQKGAGQIKTNLQLLNATRNDFPDAYIVYKLHPDVEAGLRVGEVTEASTIANFVATNSNMADLLEQVDRVATITSLAGFEALMRGKSVTCYGSPFYSGWGLTADWGAKITRRKALPSLTALIHACLIEYPRYWDPVTQEPCPIEVVVERFEQGQMHAKTGVSVRLLAKLQGIFASYAYIWR